MSDAMPTFYGLRENRLFYGCEVANELERLAPLISFGRSQLHHNCFYCGVRLSKRRSGRSRNKSAQKFTTRTRDHLIPRAAGGPTSNVNVVPACLPCNEAKADMTLEEFRAARFAGKPVEFFAEAEFRRSRGA